MPDHENQPARVSIQIGKHAAPSPHGIKKRSRPTHVKRHRAGGMQDSESEENSDDDEQTYVRQEIITSIDLAGADIDDEVTQTGSSTRHGSRGREKGEPSGANGGVKQPKAGDRESRQEASDAPENQDKPVKWGLTINMKGKGGSKESQRRGTGAQTDRSDTENGSNGKEKPAKSIDDEALEALVGSRTPKRKHTDSDAVDREPRAEDYEAVPIDDFGAHLLRNFGWDGKMRGKVKEVTRHANLTGLGAKDLKGAEDLDAWNQKTVKDSRPVRLDDYRREESKKRQRLDDRHADSYKRERERERARERERGRDR